MIDLRQTAKYAKYMNLLGWQIQNTESGIKNFVYIKTIPLLGRIAKLQRPKNLKFKDILSQTEKENIKIFYLEPEKEIKNLPKNFTVSKSSFLPAKTIHINLAQSENDLLKNMHQKTRYNIKVAKKNGVITKESSNIDEFAKTWSRAAFKRGSFLPANKEIIALYKAFGNECTLLLAYSTSNTLIGGVLVCYSPDAAFYMYAASIDEGKKLFAPTLLVWEALKIAKNKGKKVFDFEGVYDERYSSQTKAWRGFTKFKEGFGGKTVTYPKTLVYKKSFLTKLFF